MCVSSHTSECVREIPAGFAKWIPASPISCCDLWLLGLMWNCGNTWGLSTFVMMSKAMLILVWATDLSFSMTHLMTEVSHFTWRPWLTILMSEHAPSTVFRHRQALFPCLKAKTHAVDETRTVTGIVHDALICQMWLKCPNSVPWLHCNNTGWTLLCCTRFGKHHGTLMKGVFKKQQQQHSA